MLGKGRRGLEEGERGVKGGGGGILKDLRCGSDLCRSSCAGPWPRLCAKRRRRASPLVPDEREGR
jgi:hypothetical protein